MGWPLPGVVLLAPPLVSLASSFVSTATAFSIGLVALGALLVAVVVVRGPLFLLGGLHERVIHGGQVGHELLGDGAEGLGLPHPHGYISHAKDSHNVLICGSLLELRRTRVIHQSQYLLTDFSVPNFMRIQAQRTASMPSWIMLRPLTSQSEGSLEIS